MQEMWNNYAMSTSPGLAAKNGQNRSQLSSARDVCMAAEKIRASNWIGVNVFRKPHSMNL